MEENKNVLIPASRGFWRMKRVCVTGGSGFLGNEIIRQLLAAGADAFDLSRASGVDLRDLQSSIGFFKVHQPEIVIHCAAHQGGIAFQKLHPGRIYYDNMIIGANCMEAARQSGVQKHVNIIAGCAYPGDPKDGILREEEFLAGPMHPSVDNYGMTKRALVMQAVCYLREFDYHVLSLVLINLYGPGEHFHEDRSHALAALIRKFYEAKQDGKTEVVLWGSGRAVREWLYVKDAAEGILEASARHDDPAPLNLAVGVGSTIAELARMIAGIVGYSGEIVFDESKPDGALQKVAATQKADSLLSWRASTELEDGIRETLDWFIENYDAAIQEPASMVDAEEEGYGLLSY